MVNKVTGKQDCKGIPSPIMTFRCDYYSQRDACLLQVLPGNRSQPQTQHSLLQYCNLTRNGNSPPPTHSNLPAIFTSGGHSFQDPETQPTLSHYQRSLILHLTHRATQKASASSPRSNTLPPSSWHKKMESITRHGGRSLLLLGLQIVSFGPRSLAAICPVETNLIYSPFTPFDQAEYTALNNATDNACWWWAICLLSSADAARVQQFTAASLVMGLVPITLKDIAWPERRIISISHELPRPLEVLVRAPGAVPSTDTFTPEKHDISSMTLYGWTLKLPRKRFIFLLAVSAFGLLLTYGSLAVIEVYSKRSSLGCPYPIFILTWNLLAIFPAALETAFPRPV